MVNSRKKRGQKYLVNDAKFGTSVNSAGEVFQSTVSGVLRYMITTKAADEHTKAATTTNVSFATPKALIQRTSTVTRASRPSFTEISPGWQITEPHIKNRSPILSVLRIHAAAGDERYAVTAEIPKPRRTLGCPSTLLGIVCGF